MLACRCCWIKTYEIAANRGHPDLRQATVDGSSQNYGVDAQPGFTLRDQMDLVQFPLSLDDDPQVLPAVDY